MKVDSSSAWRDPSASQDGANRTPDGNRAAFEQVMRVMEKDMWPGAKAGPMTGDRLPGNTRPDATPCITRMAAFDAKTGARNACATIVSETRGAASSSSTESCDRLRAPATAPAQSARDVAQESSGVAAAAAEAPSPFWPSRNPHARHPDRLMRQLPAPALQARAAHPPIAQAATPMNRDGTSTPYRLTVMNGAAGVSVALRVSAAHTDELETLTRSALDELDSHGERGVRLIVNGVEHIPTSSRGIPHGY